MHKNLLARTVARWKAKLGDAQDRPEPARPGAAPGATLPPGCTPMGQFDPGDVFIVGYPKSGNTWVQNLLAALNYGLDLTLAPDALVQDLVPDVHAKPWFRRYSSPMFFKSHALPQPNYRQVVYLLRDGRDAMVSYLHHLQSMEHRAIDFLDLIRSGKGLFPCKWPVHVEQWLANPFQARMIIMRYEDLKKDTLAEIQRICALAGLKRAPSQVERAVRMASFPAMQARERRLGWSNPLWPKDKPFVRRGQVGSYQDEMPAEVQAAFLDEAGALLRQTGYL